MSVMTLINPMGYLMNVMTLIIPVGYPNHERYDPDKSGTILTLINPMGYPNHEQIAFWSTFLGLLCRSGFLD